MNKEQVRKAVLAVMEGKIPLVSSWCKVKSVNWGAKTCDVVIDDDEELVVKKILLGFDKQGSIAKPKANTDVLVVWINNTKTHGAVVMVQEADEMALMGDSFGGVPKAGAVSSKHNEAVISINSLRAAIAGWVVVPNDGGAALKLALASWLGQSLNATTQADYENAKVKHGQG